MNCLRSNGGAADDAPSEQTALLHKRRKYGSISALVGALIEGFGRVLAWSYPVMTDRGTSAINQPVLAVSSPFYGVGVWWSSLNAVERGLMVLAALRLAVALLFMLNVLPLDRRYGWYLHHGGDQDAMMDLAESIIAGNPQPALIGIGQPLIMIPWILVIKPFSGLDFAYVNIVVPLVLINGFLLGGLSVVVIGKVAQHLTRDDRVALWAAALWSVAPLLAYVAFFWHSDPVLVRSAITPMIGWLNGLSDGPAAFYMLLSVLLLAQLEAGASQPSARRFALVGAVFGVAVMFRVHISPMVAFLLLYIQIVYGWRALLAACLGGLIAYLPQAWYNQVVFGLPITAGYISSQDMRFWGGTLHRPLSDIIGSMPFHPQHLLNMVVYFLGSRPWLALPLGLVLLLTAYAAVALFRQRAWHAVALLLLTPLAYLIPMVLTWTFRLDAVRFSMPGMPFALILLLFAAFQLWDRFLRRRVALLKAKEMD